MLNNLLFILCTFLMHGHGTSLTIPTVTHRIPLLPPLQFPGLLHRKLPVIPTPLSLPAPRKLSLFTPPPPLGKLKLFTPPISKVSTLSNLDNKVAKDTDTTTQSSSSSTSNDLKSQSVENSNLGGNKIPALINGMPEVSMIAPVLFSTPMPNSGSTKSVFTSALIKESINNNSSSTDDSNNTLATSSSSIDLSSRNTSLNSNLADSFTSITTPSISTATTTKKPLTTIIPKSLPKLSLKAPAVKLLEKPKLDLKSLKKDSSSLTSPKGIVKKGDMDNLNNNLSSDVENNNDNNQNSSLNVTETSLAQESSPGPSIVNPIYKSEILSSKTSNPESMSGSSNSVLLLNLPNNPLYAVPGIDTPTDLLNNNKRAVQNQSPQQNPSEFSSLQQPQPQQQTLNDGTSQQYSTMNFQNVQQPVINGNPANSFQQPYPGPVGQMYPPSAGVNPQVYQYPGMNPLIDLSGNMALPGGNQPMVSIPNNDTLLVSLPILQGTGTAMSSLLNPSQPVLSSNQNEIQEPTPCTCGVFLSGQFKRGSSAQPNGNAVIETELGQSFPCNSAGKSQCTNKCLDVMVKHLPNSGAIICGSLDHDIRKEKAYLWVKNCKDVWVNTNLSSGKEHCCKDGYSIKCSSV